MWYVMWVILWYEVEYFACGLIVVCCVCGFDVVVVVCGCGVGSGLGFRVCLSAVVVKGWVVDVFVAGGEEWFFVRVDELFSG